VRKVRKTRRDRNQNFLDIKKSNIGSVGITHFKRFTHRYFRHNLCICKYWRPTHDKQPAADRGDTERNFSWVLPARSTLEGDREFGIFLGTRKKMNFRFRFTVDTLFLKRRSTL